MMTRNYRFLCLFLTALLMVLVQLAHALSLDELKRIHELSFEDFSAEMRKTGMRLGKNELDKQPPSISYYWDSTPFRFFFKGLFFSPSEAGHYRFFCYTTEDKSEFNELRSEVITQGYTYAGLQAEPNGAVSPTYVKDKQTIRIKSDQQMLNGKPYTTYYIGFWTLTSS